MINLGKILSYLQKNWAHLSASAASIITVAYNYFSTHQFTYADLVMLLTALGLISTTNSGTSTPPSAGPVVKLFLILFMIGGLSATSNAQYLWNGATSMPGIRGTAGDTITNTGTAYDSIILSPIYSSGSVLVGITKISGTVSPTVLLQASVDGYHWTTFGQDTLVLSNATGTTYFTWMLPGLPMRGRDNTGVSTQYTQTPPTLPFACYRVYATGTGTMKAIIKSYITPR